MAGSVDIIINAITSGFNNGMNQMNSAMTRSTASMGTMIKTAGAIGLAFAGISGIKDFGASMIDVTKKYQSMQAALSATVGAENAGAAFKSLQQFAKETPFSLEDVTTSYQRLINLGLNPSREAMLAYGNIAASIPNKSVTDYIEAVADAVTGENERLKEFGITAKKSGDMITYTFQGVPTTIKNTKDEIEKYLQTTAASVANGKALSEQAKTLGGAMGALGDTFQQFQNNLMNSTGAASLLRDVVDKVTNVIEYFNELLNSGAGASYFDALLMKVKPVLDIIKDLYKWVKDLFPENFGANAFKVFSKLTDDVMSFIELVRQFFVNGGLRSTIEIAGSYFLKLGFYISKVVQEGIALFVYFKNKVINIIASIATAVSEGSISAGKEAFDKGSAEVDKKFESSIKSIEDKYAVQSNVIEDLVSESGKNFGKMMDSVNKANVKRVEDVDKSIALGNKQLKDFRAKEAKDAGKDVAGDIGKKQVAKNTANAGAGSPLAKKTKKGGSSSAKSANEEVKKMLDYQQKLEEDKFKNGELSAKKYYDNLLALKLEALGKENDANSKAIQNNLDIINSSTSTDKDKQKAIENNTKLQSTMNAKTTEELEVRRDIAQQLSESNKEYVKNIQDLQKEFNVLSLGGASSTDTINEINDKYDALSKRIKAEDAEKGTKNAELLKQVKDMAIAQAKIEENQRDINTLQAEYEATLANIKYLLESGAISSTEASNKELVATNDLNNAKLALLKTSLDIANATPNFNKAAIAGIRQQTDEVKTQQIEVSERMKSLSDGIFGSLDSAFSAIIDRSKSFSDIFKDILTDIGKTITETFTKGWSEDLMSLFTKGVGSGGSQSTTGGIMSSIGSMFSSFFGGSFATGGVAKPFTINRINENGPEYLYTGSKPTKVMNNGSARNHFGNSGSGVNVVMNVTTKDANSIRKSETQMIVEMQRNIQRQVNRNS